MSVFGETCQLVASLLPTQYGYLESVPSRGQWILKVLSSIVRHDEMSLRESSLKKHPLFMI